MRSEPPGVLARIVSIATLCAVPLALFCIWANAVWNVQPTSGATFVELEAFSTAEDTSEDGWPSREGDGNVWWGEQHVNVEFYAEDRISAAYHLGENLLHLMAVVLVLVVAVVAVGVLRRRPASGALVAALGLFAAMATATALIAPRAKEWAMRSTIETFDLPTSLREARAAGVDYYVFSEPWVESFGWTVGCGAAAIVASGMMLYVLHLRRLLMRARTPASLEAVAPES